MLKGNDLRFIRANRMTGTNKKGNPYDFADITLSDGMESFKLEVKPELVPLLDTYKKGEKVDINVDVYERYDKTAFLVSGVTRKA